MSTYFLEPQLIRLPEPVGLSLTGRGSSQPLPKLKSKSRIHFGCVFGALGLPVGVCKKRHILNIYAAKSSRRKRTAVNLVMLVLRTPQASSLQSPPPPSDSSNQLLEPGIPVHFQDAHTSMLLLFILSEHGLYLHSNSSNTCLKQGSMQTYARMPHYAMPRRAQLLAGSSVASSCCCSSSKRAALRCRTHQTVVLMQHHDQHLTFSIARLHFGSDWK